MRPVFNTYTQMRPWGSWTTHFEFPSKAKVKTLIVSPGQQLSIQRHKHRNETWYLISGKGQVYMNGHETNQLPTPTREGDPQPDCWYSLSDITHINAHIWHSLRNIGNDHLVVLEVQWGGECIEEDIERQ